MKNTNIFAKSYRQMVVVFTATLVALMFTGCKDFFNISDPKSISQENFPSSMEQVNQLLTAAYAQTHAIGTYAFYWFPMGVWLYDHTTDTYGSYDERSFSMDNYSSIDSRYLTTTYTDLCKWMKFSTQALEGIESYRTKYATTEEKKTLDYMRGQALFQRALAYWHAQIFFELKAEDLGFPIIDKCYNDVEALKLSRATVKDTWLFVINDLKEACGLLKGYTDEYRVTEWAAKGLLAKVYMQTLYLFPENKTVAKALFEDIFANSGKSLVPYSVYEDMFYGNVANEHNSESLYEVTMTSNPNQAGPWAGYTTGSGMPMVYAPWYVDLDFTPKSASGALIDPLTMEHDAITSKKSSEWGNNFVHDRNISRFGFGHFHGDTVPRWTLNLAYDPAEPRSILNFPYELADPTYYSDAIAWKTDPAKVDPRLVLCAGQPYVDSYIDAKGRLTWYDRSSEINNQHDILGWEHRKYTNTRGVEMGAAPYGNNASSDCNFYIIRLADLYLLYAELIAEANPTTALEYVNKVHRRACGLDPESTSMYDYHSLTDRTYTVDDADHLAHDVIKYERWAELFAEGQWWMDVRRYRIGNEEADYFKETRHGPITWKGDCSYVQPIPQLELERNSNMKQSSGYAGI